MLVLSRRENQKILFPNLGITVEIAGIKGRNVRVGVDAPPEIRILRAELADENELPNHDSSICSRERHERNNLLNSVALQIQIAQKLLGAGKQEQASGMLQKAINELGQLDAEVARTSGSPSKSPVPRWTALLVEDDANERQLMATILTMCGFEVVVAEDGLAAIEYLQNHEKPDCVLMDMQMPRLSGPATIASLREQMEFANIPIYGVSGLRQHETNVPTGDRGVTGWFEKPVNADRLLEQILDDFSKCKRPASVTMN